jgi:hypothetical protein
MGIKPWQNRWVCPACGRFYKPEHFSEVPFPCCLVCGELLQPWRESPNWVFFLVGLIVFPLIGYLLAVVAEAVGLASATEKQAAFFLLPALLLVIDIPAYYVGQSAGNAMMRRGGTQGLLMVLGFAVSVCLLWATGHYWEVVGVATRSR